MIEEVQKERGKVYGEFVDHMVATAEMMKALRTVHRKKNNRDLPLDFEVALFYMTSKLVRLATSPDHEDSALDLASYSTLWLKEIQNENKSKS